MNSLKRITIQSIYKVEFYFKRYFRQNVLLAALSGGLALTITTNLSLISLDMACLNRLKSDIRCLVEIFPKNHSLFRVTSATVDEISCTFLVKVAQKEKKYSINANITETYPADPPVWFSDSDDISSSVQVLATTSGNDNYVRN